MSSYVQDFDAAIDALAARLLDRLDSEESPADVGEALMVLSKAEALMVVIAMARTMEEDARAELGHLVFDRMLDRRHRKLRKVLKEGYGLPTTGL